MVHNNSNGILNPVIKQKIVELPLTTQTTKSYKKVSLECWFIKGRADILRNVEETRTMIPSGSNHLANLQIPKKCGSHVWGGILRSLRTPDIQASHPPVIPTVRMGVKGKPLQIAWGVQTHTDPHIRYDRLGVYTKNNTFFGVKPSCDFTSWFTPKLVYPKWCHF